MEGSWQRIFGELSFRDVNRDFGLESRESWCRSLLFFLSFLVFFSPSLRGSSGDGSGSVLGCWRDDSWIVRIERWSGLTTNKQESTPSAKQVSARQLEHTTMTM